MTYCSSQKRLLGKGRNSDLAILVVFVGLKARIAYNVITVGLMAWLWSPLVLHRSKGVLAIVLELFPSPLQ